MTSERWHGKTDVMSGEVGFPVSRRLTPRQPLVSQRNQRTTPAGTKSKHYHCLFRLVAGIIYDDPPCEGRLFYWLLWDASLKLQHQKYSSCVCRQTECGSHGSVSPDFSKANSNIEIPIFYKRNIKVTSLSKSWLEFYRYVNLFDFLSVNGAVLRTVRDEKVLFRHKTQQQEETTR